MKIKTLYAIVSIALVFLFVGCQKSPYDKAVDYIDGLSAEVVKATNEAEYDAVYNQIVNLNANEVMVNLKALSPEQSQTIKQKAVDLTFKALAVKAILYVMPQSIKPTAADITTLANECIQKKLNVTTQPYTDVKSLVDEYFGVSK